MKSKKIKFKRKPKIKTYDLKKTSVHLYCKVCKELDKITTNKPGLYTDWIEGKKSWICFICRAKQVRKEKCNYKS